MFADDDYFYFMENVSNVMWLRAYSKTGRVKVSNADQNTGYGLVRHTSAYYHDNVVYFSNMTGNSSVAFVKAV